MTSNNTTFKPRALAPYIRATDAATGTFDHEAGVYTLQVNDLGRVAWAKSYDHEDVETKFRADSTLSIIANTLASFGVFASLMCVIAVLAQFPESWLSWLVLYLGGL